VRERAPVVATADVAILRGLRAVDLGTHVVDQPIDLTHVFTLENDTGRELNIRKIATTCGCTKAEASSQVIAPGERLDVRATLNLANAGPRREQVRILFDEIDLVVLEMIAVGRVNEMFYCQEAAVLLQNGRARVLAVQLSEDQTTPPPLSFEAPEGVTVHQESWVLVMEPSAAMERPGRWHAWIVIEADPSTSLKRQRLTIRNSLGNARHISLNGFPRS
jgi:hypothetical protein